MKKFITLIFAFVMSMAAFAQSEHMKFMGIPLDGTISDFQSKLLAKGATQNSRLSAQYPVGTRVFNGSFSGIKSEFYVYYDKKTKNVYRAKACIDEKNKKRLEERYKEVKELIKGKYKGIEKTDEFEGHESYSVEKNIGIVQIYTSEEIENNQRIYVVHVDYTDWENSSKYDDSQSDEENGGSITDENANSYSNKMDQEEVLLDKINKALQQKNAQHMKFMGIPLDGTISDFQSKLLAKGATLNSRLNAQYPFGVVVFNGVFRGENANFFIYRGKESDIVYRAKVSITKKYEEKFEAKYDELKKYIRATYKGTEKIDECCGHESYSVMVGNGAIQLSTSEVVENKQRVYVIYIDYVDKNNLYDCDVTLYYKIKSDFQSGVNKNMVQSYNNEHMKFMGIPLDGTINTFQSKLVAKGMTPNVSMNKILPIGGRAFDGYFAGYKATILVAYEKKTKVVYGAKVCIFVTNEDDLEEKYNEFKDLIKSKYDGEEKIEEINGREVYTVEIESGIINLVASVDIDGYSLQLTYCDYENSMKYIDSQLDDI